MDEWLKEFESKFNLVYYCERSYCAFVTLTDFEVLCAEFPEIQTGNKGSLGKVVESLQNAILEAEIEYRSDKDWELKNILVWRTKPEITSVFGKNETRHNGYTRFNII